MGRWSSREVTARQREVFDWVKGFIRENGLPPTVREIGGAFDIKSSTVFGLLKALEKKGYLRRGNLGARSLIIEDKHAEEDADVDTVAVRVLGRIAAGVPEYAIEEPSETITVEKRLARGRELYALRVEGESMVDAGILDGDLVIIRKQDTADNGDIVVALIGDEATLKRLHRDKNRIRLDPANKDMKPIYVDSDELRVQGKVIAVTRVMD